MIANLKGVLSWESSKLLSLPYHVRQMMLEHLICLESPVTYRCPLGDATQARQYNGPHLYSQCGMGPGWSCLREARLADNDGNAHQANDSTALNILLTHPVLRDDAMWILYRRTFRIEIQAAGVFFLQYHGADAEAKIARFPWQCTRSVQVHVDGWEDTLTLQRLRGVCTALRQHDRINHLEFVVSGRERSESEVVTAILRSFQAIHTGRTGPGRVSNATCRLESENRATDDGAGETARDPNLILGDSFGSRVIVTVEVSTKEGVACFLEHMCRPGEKV